MQIRDNISQHMTDLRAWLKETEHEPLEGMSDFFAARLDGYEEHMRPWQRAYRRMAELIPASVHTLLDVGCGTGLELDEILKLRPDLAVTGVDLSPDMLGRLREKHPQAVTAQADYFAYDFGAEKYDMAISFETLHHFPAERKRALFEKLLRALKPGGVYLQADYIACCDEEETLLAETCAARRARDGIAPERFVHFDTPLTLECIEGACFIVAEKGENS